MEKVSKDSYLTFGIPYMGSKKKLIKHISSALSDKNYEVVLDAFSGTTRVGQYFRSQNKTVISNDLSDASKCYGSLFLQLQDTSILEPYIEEMNSLEGYEGWFTQNYHGDVTDAQRGDGRFMQYKNCIKVDAVRDYVESLEVSLEVKQSLIAIILFAIPTVDNTLGQQQAYLKEWCDRSCKDIIFKIPGSIEGPVGTVTQLSCFDTKLNTFKPDLVYIDPPYSKNVWYPSYYHIYDSVAKWDKPDTVGKAKRRVDRSAIGRKQGIGDTFIFENNLWYQDDQTEAFTSLLDNFPDSDFLISYSSDSSLSKEQAMKLFSEYGEVTFYSIDHKTNVLGVLGKSSAGNKIVTPKGKVSEYLFMVNRF